MFKICVFNLCLKLSDVFMALTDCGKLFQTFGRPTDKGQSPNLFLVHGTMYSELAGGGTYMLISRITADRCGIFS